MQKNYFKQFALTVAVLLCSMVAKAQDFKVDGICYRITSFADLTVEVAKGEHECSGMVVIPTTVIYKSKDLTVTNIADSAFYNCTNISGVTIGNSVTNVGGHAFEVCTNLSSVIIGDGVSNIKVSAFEGCTGLTSIIIGNNVETIGGFAFAKCKSLKKLVIPANVTEIGESAFGGCISLKDLRIEDSETVLEFPGTAYGNTFSSCPLETIYLGRNMNYETSPKFGPSPSSPFVRQDALKSLTISNKVTVIDDYLFYQCSGLTSVTIPNSVTSIGAWAFRECLGLTSIAIPDNVESIGERAFCNCTSLADVIIGNGVASIEKGAFTNCPLEIFKCERNIPAILGEDVFSGVDLTSTVLKVPAGSKDVYSNMDGWNDFWNIEEFYYDRYFYVNYIVDDLLFARDSIKHGAEVILIEAPTKEGYTFSGWSEAPSTMPAEDIIISGSFTANRYEVTYIVDGEVYASDSIAYGTALEPLAAPAKEGHTFSGWSEIPATMPAEDVTITGSFAVNSYLLTYIVDGEIYASDSIAYGTTIEPLAEPAKDGYTFGGWSEIPATMPAEDVTITGSFAVNSYLLTYIVDGEIYASDSIAYGTALEPLAEPAKDGYTFSGWSEIPDAMPAHDVTITGRFIANEKCATPIIGYEGGKLKICCDTEGAEFVTIITDSDIATHYNAEIELAATYNISAYATLAGYENSDIATATLCWIEKESVSTDIIEVMSSAVLITCKDGRINICCGQDGVEVLVYDINGTTIGSATIINGNAILDTSLLKGEIAIVNIAGKGIKVVMQ